MGVTLTENGIYGVELPPPVIPKTRTVTLGGQRYGRETLLQEINTQSLADVRALIARITRDVARQQLALGNPPQVLEVDGNTSTPVEAVQKKTVTLYGVVLAAAAMREVELALAQAIAQATTPHTGRLGDVASSWQWLFIRKGRTAQPVSSASLPRAFSAGDQLVLVPRAVPYATIVNAYVSRGGRLNKAPRKGKFFAPRRTQNRGFLFWAAEAARKKTAFKQFAVFVAFTKAHRVPGEVMTRTSGTGVIVIRPRFRQG
jgi:hypothetical protein